MEDRSKSGLSLWMLMRVGGLLLSLAGSPAFLEMEGDFSRPSISIVLVALVFCPLAIWFVMLMQARHSWAEDELAPASWHTSPFSFRQPANVITYGACMMMASGIGALAIGLLHSPRNWAGELPLVFGIGFWIGVRLQYPMRRD